MSTTNIHVAKLGGSLLDLPDLLERFERWHPKSENLLLVVGGGEAADVVRRFDAMFNLGPERGHWLAVRAMALNTHVLAAKLDRCALVTTRGECDAVWARGDVAVIEPTRWLENEEQHEGVLVPHRWSFTSDSIAAHVATRVGAARLTLLKSTVPAKETPAGGTAGLGDIVDDDFAEASGRVPRIEVVNLRSTPFERCVLR